MDFPGFETVELAPSRDVNYVYVVGIVDFRGGFVPFYVGESSRLLGRIADHVKANFSAPTDFKVGEAVKRFQEIGYTVRLKFKESENPREDEKRLIHRVEAEMGDAFLLNNLRGYDYKTAVEPDERSNVHDFVDNFLRGMAHFA